MPLLWAAAGDHESTAVLDWLRSAAQTFDEPLNTDGGDINGDAATRAGCTALRAAMRRWGVESAKRLARWLAEEGFPRTRAGAHISARAQEHVMMQAVRVDARAALLESVCVAVTLAFGRRAPNAPVGADGAGTATPLSRAARRRERAARYRPRAAAVPAEPPSDAWSWLEDVDVRGLFLLRVPMLKSCPAFLRGRLRQAFRVALVERQRAQREGDEANRARAWKLFGLVPMMLLWRPLGAGSVGREDLERRANALSRGQWVELLQAARDNATRRPKARRRQGNDDGAQRGHTAHANVKVGDVSRARQCLAGGA